MKDPKDLRSSKTIWKLIFTISTILLLLALLPPIEICFGMNMPFIKANFQEFSYFGFEIQNKFQIGFMLICALVLILTSRLSHLSWLKIKNINEKLENWPYYMG